MTTKVKKPWYKRVWVWILIIFFIIGCIGNAAEEGAAVNTSPTEIAEVTIKETTSPTETQHIHNIESTIFEATYLNGKYQINKCTTCDFEEQIELSKCLLPIQFVYNYYEVDYVGGVTLDFTVKNLTDKPIKYIDFDITFYNAVGDAIRCDIDWQYTHHWKITGPIEDSVKFRPGGFYNGTFKGTIVLDNVKIIFMDDTRLTISDDKYEGDLVIS